MHRKHLFPLVVLLAAAAVAGLLALTRTVDLGQPATASTGSDPAIAFRLKELDRFELSLREQLAKAKTPAAVAPKTIYRRAAAPASQAARFSEHKDEDEHEDEGRDD
jgi:ribosomal protein L12E/L44/L45/RPP1/RPP2